MVHGVPTACKKHGWKHNNNPVMRGFKSFGSANAFLVMKAGISAGFFLIVVYS